MTNRWVDEDRSTDEEHAASGQGSLTEKRGGWEDLMTCHAAVALECMDRDRGERR